MSLIPSLLRAIVTVGGQSLVLQAGEKPYVSSTAGPIDLTGSGITTEAISDVIGQLLPHESQQILTQFGAVQHDLAEVADFPGERFRIVATNEGTTIGVEIRRLQPAAQTPVQTSPASRPPVAEPPAPPRRRQSDQRDDVPRAERGSGAAAAARLPMPLLHDMPPVANAPATERQEQGVLLERLLQAAFAEGASALYLTAGVKPWIRADDDLRVLGDESALTAAQIDTMLARAPDSGMSASEGTREWFWEFPELGRLRCTSFRDHRGPGLVLRAVPTRAATSRQLGLSREAEELVARGEGLVIAAAPHINDAHALVAALVDVVNRTRRAHVICVQREVTAIHESEASLISQREAGRSIERILECARAALREQPDVLVLDTMPNADLMALAIDAAHSGHLVVCAVRSNGVNRALENLTSLFAPAERVKTQVALSRALVGVVAETDETGDDGRVRRELLVNTPESAYLIAEGRLGGLGHPDRRR